MADRPTNADRDQAIAAITSRVNELVDLAHTLVAAVGDLHRRIARIERAVGALALGAAVDAAPQADQRGGT